MQTYPKPEAKTKPVWFDAMQKADPQLHNILSQMYLAHDNQAHILTAIGLRTALDRATEVLGIDPAKTFDEKLNQLRDGGWIGQAERDILGVVTDAGNGLPTKLSTTAMPGSITKRLSNWLMRLGSTTNTRRLD